MKLSSILFAAMVASTSYAAEDQIESRDLSSLANKWNITDPAFVYGSLGFTLQYGINQYILDNERLDMIRWSIWDENCKPTDGTDGHLIWESENGATQEIGFKEANGTASPNLQISYPQIINQVEADGAYTIGVQIDADKITQNTNVYTEYTVDNQLTAEVRFCNRFELWTPRFFFNGDANPTPLEVNFVETLVTLTVDLTDGFEIGSIAVEPKDRVVRTANQVYQVVGFLCNDDNEVLSNAEIGRARNQGEVVRVCVEPEPDAKNDGIKMRSVDSFTFTRDSFNQVAIVNGGPAPNLLTTYEPTLCRGRETCWFETILFANFYTSVGAVAGSGIASMQFGTAQSRRRLRSGDRDLQEDDAAAAAEFELEFDVAQTVQTASGASGMSTMVLLGSAIMSSIIATIL